jgi:hypothetical protein
VLYYIIASSGKRVGGMDEQTRWPDQTFQELTGAVNDTERVQILRERVLTTHPAPEGLQLDCKSVTTADGTPTEKDLEQFAKEACGFANSAGGFIIWGVEWNDRQTSPPRETGVPQCGKFARELDARGKNLTFRPVEFRNLAVSCSNLPEGDGFVITYVPESPVAPHRVQCATSKKYHNHYLRRYSDRTDIMSHPELEDAFGTRQRPALLLQLQFVKRAPNCLALVCDVQNHGRATAFGVTLEIRLTVVTGPQRTCSTSGQSLAVKAMKRDVIAGEPNFWPERDYAVADSYVPLNSKPIRSEDGHLTLMEVRFEWSAVVDAFQRNRPQATTLEIGWTLGAYNMRPRRGTFLLPLSPVVRGVVGNLGEGLPTRPILGRADAEVCIQADDLGRP